jgi:thymidylate synthase (FAD)
MRAVLLRYTPDPERAVAAAARVCYSPLSVTELEQELSEEDISRLLRFLQKAGHTSTFEHASFTFGLEGSRACLNQLVRHRIASYSQQSQRYVEASSMEFIVPPAVEAQGEAAAVFEGAVRQAREAYARLLALGVPKEDARYVLPVGALSRIVATYNARSLHNLFALRCCERAQWEIRNMAREMLRLAREAAPRLFLQAGPPCEAHGICREGEMSCGRLKQLRAAARQAKEASPQTG